MGEHCDACALSGHATRCTFTSTPLLLEVLLLLLLVFGQFLLWQGQQRLGAQYGQALLKHTLLLEAVTFDKELADCLPLEQGPMPR